MQYKLKEYYVKPWDSLFSIAEKYRTTILELISINKLRYPILRIGQRLLIPINRNLQSSDSWRYELTPEYVKQTVTEVKLDKSTISPNGDGIDDVVNGTVTVAKKYNGRIVIRNAIGTHIKTLISAAAMQPGTYSFTWDGRDDSNNKVYNGAYYVVAQLWEGEGTGAYRFDNTKLTVTDSVELLVPQNEQKVRVKYPETNVFIEPDNNYDVFKVSKDRIFPIIAFVTGDIPSYLVEVEQGAPGRIAVQNVDITDLNTIPEKWGRPAISGVFARTAPLDTSEIKEILFKNTPVRILRQDGDWYRVLLVSGDQLYLHKEEVEETPAPVIYIIISGDTLWRIAQRFGTTVDTIIKVNNLNVNTPLFIGQKLVIPPKVTGTSAGNIYLVPVSSPEITYVKLSTRVAAFEGNKVPAYLTVDIETKVPTKGYIDVIGSSDSTKINLSTDTYRTEHIVSWVPWNDVKKQPLAPGDYQLKLNLFKTDGSSITGIDLGKLTIVAESQPKALITNVNIPSEFTPKNDPAQSTTDFYYTVNRTVKVQIIIRDNVKVYFHSPLETKTPGNYSLEWSGRDDQGNLLPNGLYTVEFKVLDPFYNAPELTTDNSKEMSVVNSDYRIPVERVMQLVKDVKLNSLIITPNGDGVQDTITGTVTFTGKVTAQINIVNIIGSYTKMVLPNKEYIPGTYSFTWNGKTAYLESAAPNGTYYAEAVIYEGGNKGGFIYKDQPIKLSGTYDIQIPKPEQKVRVIVESTEIPLTQVMGGTYYGKKGEVYTIIEYLPDNTSYNVRIAENITGRVPVFNVELIDLDSIPQKWGMAIADGTSVRPGPNTAFPEIYVLQKGSKVRILRNDFNWYRIILPSGRQAYVKASDLVETEPPANSGVTTYTIVAGDTLWKIAQKFNVTVTSIVIANNINVSDFIYIGQKLVIPLGTPQSTVPIPQIIAVYTIKSGDTLWKIAQQFAVTIDEIARANNILVAQPIYIGSKLNIPKVHTASSIQSLSYIAQMYFTTVQSLAQINNLDPGKPLYDGQRLIISL